MPMDRWRGCIDLACKASLRARVSWECQRGHHQQLEGDVLEPPSVDRVMYRRDLGLTA